MSFAAQPSASDFPDAITAGDLARIKYLIAAKFNVNIQFGTSRTTPLYLASQLGKADVVQALLSAKADANIPTSNGQTALMAAAAEGHADIVKALISVGANIEATTINSETALILASQFGRNEVVELLLANKANVNKTDNRGGSALFKASQLGHADVVLSLIAAKADVNIKRLDGTSPLYAAAQNDHLDVVQALIAAKSDVNAKAADAATPLIIASLSGHLAVVQTLISASADVNISGPEGATALFAAAQEGNIEVIKVLLAARADIDKKTLKGASPLFIACLKGNANAVRALLDAGADVNAQTNDGDTPFRAAFRSSNSDSVKMIISALKKDGSYKNKPASESIAIIAAENGAKLDLLDIESVRAYIDKLPSGKMAPIAIAALSYISPLNEIENHMREAKCAIPFEKLQDFWLMHNNLSSFKGAVLIYVKDNDINMGSFMPTLGAQIWPYSKIDPSGVSVLPTAGGSLYAFSTNGLPFEFINKIIITTPANEKLVFGVVNDIGLVPVVGVGTILVPGLDECIFR